MNDKEGVNMKSHTHLGTITFSFQATKISHSRQKSPQYVINFSFSFQNLFYFEQVGEKCFAPVFATESAISL